jgi:ABC-type protease/lipase transport system fused ATPase/permease subunit
MKACALNVDVAAFPAGKDTMVGINGMSLSVGQKQRLTLVRVLYFRKSMFVLGDVPNGLDD